MCSGYFKESYNNFILPLLFLKSFLIPVIAPLKYAFGSFSDQPIKNSGPFNRSISSKYFLRIIPKI